jgi:hypothetical protein
MATRDQTEEAHVAAWLRQAAEQESVAVRGRRLPSAGHLWWKAQIIRRLVERDRMAERATRPVRWSQWAGLGLACLLLTLFAAWLGFDLLSQLDAEALRQAASGPRGLAVLFLAGTVLPLLGFAVFWTMWRDV